MPAACGKTVQGVGGGRIRRGGVDQTWEGSQFDVILFLSPIRLHRSTWTCTGDITDAGPRRPIRLTRAFPEIREQMFLTPRRPQHAKTHPPPQNTMDAMLVLLYCCARSCSALGHKAEYSDTIASHDPQYCNFC